MFGSLFRILRPVRLIKRKGLLSGVFGGNRVWLALGGIVWAGGKVRRLFGFGDPAPVFAEEIKPGERFVVAHAEPSRRRRRKR